MAADTFRDRIFRAWSYLQIAHGGSLSQLWLAKELGKAMGRPEAFSGGAISRYMGGQVPGDVETIVGLAKVLGVDPGWLLFGSDSSAPEPEPPTNGT